VNALLHHSKKDLRQHRGLIIAWLLLLAADAVMTCSSLMGEGISTLTDAMLIPLGVGVALALGWADSPAVGDHFLATRPITARSVWASKILTLGLFVLLPALLQGLATSAWLGLGAEHAGMLTMERALLLIPALAIMLCLGGLEPRRLGIAAGLGPVVGYSGAAIGVGLACHLGDIQANQSSLLYVLWIMAGTMVLMLWRQIGRPRRLTRNLGIYALGMLVVFTVQLAGPVDLFPPTAMSTQAVPELRVSLSGVPHGGFTNERVSLAFTPRVEGLPEGWTAMPIATSGHFGTFTFAPKRGELARLRRSATTRGNTKDEQQALAALCGVEMLFSNMRTGAATAHAGWPKAAVEQSAELELDLEFTLLEYERVSAPTTVRMIAYGDTPWEFQVRLRTPQFRFSRDLSSRSQRAWQLADSFAYVLVDPVHNRAVLCAVHSSGRGRGGWSGYPELNVTLSADVPKGLWRAKSLDEVELQVFRRIHRGSARATLTEPDFALDRRLLYRQPFHRDSIDATEHDLQLNNIPEGDTRALLDLIANTSHRFSLWEPAPQRLRAIGERDFSELLSYWQRYSNSGQQVLGMVVNDLLDESHKAELLSAIPQHPDLAYLAVSRGWEAEIREPMLTAFASPKPATPRMYQALLLLDDPSVYPTLLAKYAEAPSIYFFDLLERVPALRPELDRLTREYWKRMSRVFGRDDVLQNQPLELALRVGDSRALELLKECMLDTDSRRRYGDHLVKAMRPVLHMPRQQNAALAMLARGDFRYHPERRLYLANTEDSK
jgi:hypothetical protein